MDELESFVNVALADPAIELEIRIGKIAFGQFRTDVPSDAWDLVKRRLESNKKWSSTDTVTFVDERTNKVRRRTFSDGRVEIVQKERMAVHDVPMPNRPMDLRVSLAREKAVSIGPADRITATETKKRYRYVHKGIWAFELTETHGTKDIDSECATRYQIEIEFLPSESSRTYPCKYLADYGKLLADDVLSMMKT